MNMSNNPASFAKEFPDKGSVVSPVRYKPVLSLVKPVRIAT